MRIGPYTLGDFWLRSQLSLGIIANTIMPIVVYIFYNLGFYGVLVH